MANVRQYEIPSSVHYQVIYNSSVFELSLSCVAWMVFKSL